MLNKFFFTQHLDDEEEIRMVVHKHWMLGFKALWFPSLVFIAVWSLLYFAHTKYVVYGISLASLFFGLVDVIFSEIIRLTLKV